MKTDIFGMRPPERPVLPTHIQWTGDNAFLSEPEVAAVRAHCDALETHAGTIGNGSATEAKHVAGYRSVETAAVKGLDWLYERIIKKVALANAEHYRFTL